MDITINLDHEELQKALENGTLAALAQKCSYGGNAVIEPVGENASTPIPTSEPPTPSPEPKQAPTPEPVTQTPEPAPTPVPTTPATYTLDELQRAAVGLMDKGMSSTDLVAMLGEFGVQAITEVPADQFGAFAMKLREKGAEI